MPWLMERYGDRLRGIGFDKIAEGQSSDSDEVPLDPRHNNDDAPRSCKSSESTQGLYLSPGPLSSAPRTPSCSG